MEHEKSKKARKSNDSERVEESSDGREHSESPRKSPKKPEQRKDFNCDVFKIEIKKVGRAHYSVRIIINQIPIRIEIKFNIFISGIGCEKNA